MMNKYFPEEEITSNDLLFMCYMIERIGRRIKQTGKYIVNKIGSNALYHLISCADVLHCDNPQKIEDDWVNTYQLTEGSFDRTIINPELTEKIPSPLEMANVYQRLIEDTSEDGEDYIHGMIRVYNSPICTKIDNYNCSAYYEPSYIIARAYYNGGF